VELPDRLTISTCAGCGAMREFESCAGACAEHKLELVSAGEYDALRSDAAARRIRIRAFRTVTDELAEVDPGPERWRVAYEPLRRSARSVLERFGPAARSPAEDSLSSAETVVVWRCSECGGVDAPQPCIGVCIWRPADWAPAGLYEAESSRAVLDRESEGALVGLLGRLAFVTPHEGAWEQNWLALRSQARSVAVARITPQAEIAHDRGAQLMDDGPRPRQSPVEAGPSDDSARALPN
jgi:hypothetical protein